MLLATEEEFWIDAAEDLAVPEQNPIAVYTNGRGRVVLRQRDRDGDSILIVRPEYASGLARALLREIGLEHLLSSSGDASSSCRRSLGDGSATERVRTTPKDRTAAERQRRRRARDRDAGRDTASETRDVRDIEAPERDMFGDERP